MPRPGEFSKGGVLQRTMTLLPHIREVGLMAGTYFAYMYTRKLVFSDVEGVAFSNARRIVDLERSLGFFWEPHWQQWTLDSVRGAVIFFNWAYIMTFWPIVITTAVITYSLDRSRYFYFRNVVLLTFAFALIVFMLFPLAPPRMLPAYFVDTIDQLGPSFYASREAANYYNAFAAMPSLHFTWTAVLGVMFFRLGPSLLKVLGVAYPTMTLLAITITGNHYIVDAVVGAVIAAARGVSGSTPQGARLSSVPLPLPRAAVQRADRLRRAPVPDRSTARRSMAAALQVWVPSCRGASAPARP